MNAHIYTDTPMCTHTHARTTMPRHACIHTHTPLHKCTPLACLFTCAHIYAIHTCTAMYTHTYTCVQAACTHMHAHIYPCTNIRVCEPALTRISLSNVVKKQAAKVTWSILLLFKIASGDSGSFLSICISSWCDAIGPQFMDKSQIGKEGSAWSPGATPVTSVEQLRTHLELAGCLFRRL